MGEQTNYKRFRLDLYLNEDHPVDAAITVIFWHIRQDDSVMQRFVQHLPYMYQHYPMMHRYR